MTSLGRKVIDVEMERQMFVNNFLLHQQRRWDPEWNPISRTCRVPTWSTFFVGISGAYMSIWDALFRKLEEEMAAHSCILAWEVAWIEDPGGPQPMGSPRGHRTE